MLYSYDIKHSLSVFFIIFTFISIDIIFVSTSIPGTILQHVLNET